MDFSPRVGFAYDLSGDGRRVMRGGYGLYFDQYNTAASAGDITVADPPRPLNVAGDAGRIRRLASASWRLTVSASIRCRRSRPRATVWRSTRPASGSIRTIDDPRTHQVHIGYAHTLAANTTLAVDYTHIEGRHEVRSTELNPIINGAPAAGERFPAGVRQPDVLESTSTSSRRSTSRDTTG